jgi:hypothetical protein
VNGDRVVNVLDVAPLQAAMGGAYDAEMDVNGDGKLNAADAQALMGHIGWAVVAPSNGQGSKTIRLARPMELGGDEAVDVAARSVEQSEDTAGVAAIDSMAAVRADLRWVGLEDAVRYLVDDAAAGSMTESAGRGSAVDAAVSLNVDYGRLEVAGQAEVLGSAGADTSASVQRWATALLPASARDVFDGLTVSAATDVNPGVGLLRV